MKWPLTTTSFASRFVLEFGIYLYKSPFVWGIHIGYGHKWIAIHTKGKRR